MKDNIPPTKMDVYYAEENVRLEMHESKLNEELIMIERNKLEKRFENPIISVSINGEKESRCRIEDVWERQSYGKECMSSYRNRIIEGSCLFSRLRENGYTWGEIADEIANRQKWDEQAEIYRKLTKRECPRSQDLYQSFSNPPTDATNNVKWTDKEADLIRLNYHSFENDLQLVRALKKYMIKRSEHSIMSKIKSMKMLGDLKPRKKGGSKK